MPRLLAALAVVIIVGLSACASRNADAPESPRDDTAPADSPRQPVADQMPGATLGTYDADPAACAEITTMDRLVVSPDTLRFYYGYATVDSVAAHDEGVTVGATLYQLEGVPEVVPEPATYRIVPSDGGLRFEYEGGTPVDLVRCGASETESVRPGDGRRSVYTRLDLDECRTLREYEESGGAEFQCRGYGGVPLFVSEGDLRFDVDAGVPDGEWTSPSPFNSLGETVEWRLHNQRPVAVIVRYAIVGPDGTEASGRSDLAVIRVGREGAPGCLVGYVPGTAEPSQNEAARALADRSATTDECARP